MALDPNQIIEVPFGYDGLDVFIGRSHWTLKISPAPNETLNFQLFWGTNTVPTHVAHVSKELFADLLNRELHQAYLRIRAIIGHEAYKTPHAPTLAEIYEVTEHALRMKLLRLTEKEREETNQK